MATPQLNIKSTERIPSIAEQVALLVATAPPLTAEQCARIRDLLTPRTMTMAVAA